MLARNAPLQPRDASQTAREAVGLHHAIPIRRVSSKDDDTSVNASLPDSSPTDS